MLYFVTIILFHVKIFMKLLYLKLRSSLVEHIVHYAKLLENGKLLMKIIHGKLLEQGLMLEASK